VMADIMHSVPALVILLVSVLIGWALGLYR
jgi:hypothetical protein